MCENLGISDKLSRVRDKLNSEKVQLWTPPYYLEGVGASDSDLQILAERYSASIGLSLDCCLCALTELQSAALENLDSRSEFLASGLANFKIKVPNGNVRVSARLEESGSVLIQRVAEKLNLSPERVRLIGKGKLVDGEASLASQGVNNNQKFLVIILEENAKDREEKEGVHRRLQTAKDDAMLLMTKENKYMTMEDQHGNAVHLPPDEQKAIMLALAIHEKGKAALKRSHFNEALYLLLEADTQYSLCRSQLLSSVDNYALLYLDIVWCYLKLRSADYLQDAERRLKMCEEQLIASYGPQMRRVEQIKQTSANERCLLMRLHLMQGIVLYHQNKRDDSRLKFNEVQLELQALQIDEESLKTLTEMGFTENESRIALREANGDLNEAVSRIYRKREVKQSARKAGRKERKIAEQGSGQGKDGELWVNPKTLTTLTEMGYELEAARMALRESGNDIETALVLLSDIPGLMAQCKTNKSTSSCETAYQDSKLMDRILKSKISKESAAKVLLAIRGLSVEKRNSFFDQLQSYEGDKQDIVTVLLDSLQSESSSSTAIAAGSSKADEMTEAKAVEIANKLLEEQSAYERFSEDISFEEDDHLDFPLIDEERLLLEYISVLGM